MTYATSYPNPHLAVTPMQLSQGVVLERRFGSLGRSCRLLAPFGIFSLAPAKSLMEPQPEYARGILHEYRRT